MHIYPHEFVSIIGPSGSGKSTLMNIIGCLDTADGGRYCLDGIPIEDYTENQLARVRNEKIGFVRNGRPASARPWSGSASAKEQSTSPRSSPAASSSASPSPVRWSQNRL